MNTTPHIELRIGRVQHPVCADYSMRFVDVPGQNAEPVLYFRGYRVAQEWSIEMLAEVPADKNRNANTT